MTVNPVPLLSDFIYISALSLYGEKEIQFHQKKTKLETLAKRVGEVQVKTLIRKERVKENDAVPLWLNEFSNTITRMGEFSHYLTTASGLLRSCNLYPTEKGEEVAPSVQGKIAHLQRNKIIIDNMIVSMKKNLKFCSSYPESFATQNRIGSRRGISSSLSHLIPALPSILSSSRSSQPSPKFSCSNKGEPVHGLLVEGIPFGRIVDESHKDEEGELGTWEMEMGDDFSSSSSSSLGSDALLLNNIKAASDSGKETQGRPRPASRPILRESRVASSLQTQGSDSSNEVVPGVCEQSRAPHIQPVDVLPPAYALPVILAAAPPQLVRRSCASRFTCLFNPCSSLARG